MSTVKSWLAFSFFFFIITDKNDVGCSVCYKGKKEKLEQFNSVPWEIETLKKWEANVQAGRWRREDTLTRRLVAPNSSSKISSFWLLITVLKVFCIFNFVCLLFPWLDNFDSPDDAVYEELQKPDGEMKSILPLDEDLPGMGQYYCLHCEYVILFIYIVNSVGFLFFPYLLSINLGQPLLC
jgi:hypothetical protein